MIILDKVLTLNDVEKLNLSEQAIVILHNTLGQNPEIIEKLNDSVQLRVLGGYDSNIDARYNDEHYAQRTYYNPKDLANAMRQMQAIENLVNPNWNEIKKALFIYECLVKNVQYDYHLKYLEDNRNLNALNVGYARCAGFAMCYKEFMDRLGIANTFKNVPFVHSFNVLQIENNSYAIDTTWARNEYDTNGDYLKYFCFQPDNFITHGTIGTKTMYSYSVLQRNKIEALHNQLNMELSSDNNLDK